MKSLNKLSASKLTGTTVHYYSQNDYFNDKNSSFSVFCICKREQQWILCLRGKCEYQGFTDMSSSWTHKIHFSRNAHRYGLS